MPTPGGGRARRRRTPARRAPCGRSSAPERSRARSASIVRGWMLPHFRCDRHARGAVELRPVAAVVVVRHGRRRGSPASARARRPLAGLGQLEVAGRRPGRGSAVGAERQPRHPVRRGATGAAPAVLGPGAGERRVDLVGRRRCRWSPGPGRRRTASRCGTQLDLVLGERLLDRLVAAPPVRAEVGGDVHPVGADLPGHLRAPRVGRVAPHADGTSRPPQRGRRARAARRAR